MQPSAHAVGPDPDVVVAADAALDDHWALRSLGASRRAQILAAAAARATAAPEGEGATADVATAPAPEAAPRGGRRRALVRPRRMLPPIGEPVSDADTLHLAGAYDLAARDAIAALRAFRAEDPATPLGDAALPAEHRVLEAQVTVAASRAFTLLAALPLERPAAGDADASAADAEAAVLHRLLHLAALAEVGGCRGDWLRWMERHAPTLAPRLPTDASLADAADADADGDWEARLRTLVVTAWVGLLRRSGPSGLDDAAALLARAREERDAREAAWLAAVEAAGGTVAVVRARFRLFALAHVGDAAVDTLLYLRHGARHATAEAADRAVRRRLQLAREAGAGDVQLDGVLTWLREAARHVIGRGSPQLEIDVDD